MKALFRMIFSHKGHKERRDGKAGEMDFGTKEQKVRGGECMEVGMNDSTIQRSNDPTSQRANHQTTKLPNHQTISGQLARWAAVAAGGRGMRLEGARETHTEALRHGEGRGGHMGRMGHTGLMGHMARWAAVAAVAVAGGLLLGSAREAEAGMWTGGAAA